MIKEKFVEIINEIKKLHEFEDELYILTRKYNYDMDIPFPTLEDIVVTLLDEIFQCTVDDPFGSDISYFIYDLNFGKDWKPGLITDKDGNDIDHSTAEKLYDYLVNNMSR